MKKRLLKAGALAVLGWTVVLAAGETTETNLVATVTASTVTNIVESDNHQGCSTCDGIAKFHWALNHFCDIPGPFIPATERTVVTNIYSRTEVVIHWNGKRLVHHDDTLLSSSTNRFKLVSEWKQD